MYLPEPDSVLSLRTLEEFLVKHTPVQAGVWFLVLDGEFCSAPFNINSFNPFKVNLSSTYN